MSRPCDHDKVRVGWGAGLILGAELSTLRDPLDYVVDSDAEKWGTEVYGLPVKAPETLKGENTETLELHIFASRWPAICDALRGLGFDEEFIAEKVVKPDTADFPEFLVNYRALQLESLKSIQVQSRPLSLNFDITNVCNLKCPLCPTGQGDRRYPRGRMSFDNFRRIIDEIGRTASDVYLFNWGEAFLHPDLFRMIRYVKQNTGSRVTISSNFNIVTDEQLADLVDSGLDFLSLSIDGSSQEVYGKYRVGGDFAQVMAHIDRLQQIKADKGVARPAIEWCYLVHAYNDAPEEIERARTMAEARGLLFALGTIHVDMGREIEEGLESQLAVDGHWISPHFSAYDLEKKERAVKKTHCRIPWEIAYINWDGELAPCCGLYDPKYSFGNIFRSSFAEVWNGPGIQAARDVLIDNKETEHICSRCRQGGYIV